MRNFTHLFLMIFLSATAFSQSSGIPISTAANEQDFPAMIADGNGNAIIVWHDRRGNDNDLYAQKISLTGGVLWQTDGVPVCTVAGNQGGQQISEGHFASGIGAVAIAPDGSGGAIVTWRDDRNGALNGDIFAQRIFADGSIAWAPEGVTICTADGEQSEPQIISDDAGGAIITWEDFRNSNGADIYAQRISGNGTVQWQNQGVVVCNANYGQRGPLIVSDTQGGAIIFWVDLRSPALPPQYDIYAQRLSPSGAALWQNNGVTICRASGDQYIYPNSGITEDGFGGAIISWYDRRSGGFGTDDIYAQRVDASGAVLWQTDGVLVCNATDQQLSPVVAADGSGGVFIAWQDLRLGNFDYRVYAQYLNSSGAPQWQQNGIAVSTAQSGFANILATTPGSCIILWQDFGSENANPKIQGLNASGTALYASGGQELADGPEGESQFRTAHIVEGNFIACWQDSRNGDYDIFASVGSPGPINQQALAIADFFVSTGSEPNFLPLLRNDIVPQGAEVEIIITNPPEIGEIVSIESDGVWYQGDGDYQESFAYDLSITSTNGAGLRKTTRVQGSDVSLASLLFCYCPLTLSACPPLVAERAEKFSPFNQILSTVLDDSVDVDAFYRFRDEVLSQTPAGNAIIEAYYDNTPEVLGILLFKRPDLLSQATETFVMLQEPVRDLLDGTGSTVISQELVDNIKALVDGIGGAGSVELQEILTSNLASLGPLDEQVGKPVSEAASSAIGATVGVRESNTKIPEKLTLEKNYPNPFNPETTLRYALPQKQHVQLVVYNLRGEVVATLVNATLEAGEHTAKFTADNLASGVYFARLSAGAQVKIRKMLLVR